MPLEHCSTPGPAFLRQATVSLSPSNWGDTLCHHVHGLVAPYTHAMSTLASYGGPIDYMVFSFPPGAVITEGLTQLLDCVHRGIIEILDFEVVSRTANGDAAFETLESLRGIEGFELSRFEGAQSDILDADDLTAIAESLKPGWRAIALVYEERSLASVAAAWDRAGGELLLAGGIDYDELEDALARTSIENGEH